MNEVQTTLATLSQDVSLGHGDLRGSRRLDMQLTPLSDFIHEVRQPLEVIETLAYYLEMTSSDDRVCAHLQKIQAMVLRANQILQKTEDSPAFRHK